MTIQCPITVTVTAPVTPTMSAACAAWIASRGIDLNAVTSDDVFAAFSAVNSGVIDYACGQAIAAAYQAPPAPTVQYAAPDGSTPPGTTVCILSVGMIGQNYVGTIVRWAGTTSPNQVYIVEVNGSYYSVPPNELKIGVC